MRLSWPNTYGPSGGSGGFKILSYTCGYCDNRVAAGSGYHATKVGVPSGADYGRQVSKCPHCNEPAYLSADGRQVPGPSFGGTVAHLPSEEVAALYDEAQDCMKVNAHTASVMYRRKLLMHVAVSEGADENKTFAYYVRYLAEEGHIPPKATAWVDRIRDNGNDANHEIDLVSREDADQLIKFSEMRMGIMYEYPAEVAAPAHTAVEQDAGAGS